MEIITMVVGLIIGGLIGIAIGILKSRNRQVVLETQLESTKEILAETRNEAARQLSEAKADFQKQRELSLSEQQLRFDETIAKVQQQLKVATDEMLKQRQQEFAKTNGQNMEQIVSPLKETIKKMEDAMKTTSKEQSELSGVLKSQIENAIKMSENAKNSAEELSRVFKHKSKIQGDWGESVLKDLLDGQGAHYDTQETLRDIQGKSIKTEDGHSLRPDVILHLDSRREVIIDSKVSMTAFMDYVNAETDELRAAALDSHISSIKKHVDELSRKDYSSYIVAPKVKMDYVIMFVPHSAALWAALNEAPTLWRDAMAKHVYIVDEQTLYAALRMIDLTWTQIAQAQNHEKVFELANEMIERVGQFMEKYQAIGAALNKAQSAYEEGEKKLSPRGKSVVTTCGKLMQLGAKQNDKHPVPGLLDIDEALLENESDE